MKGVLKMAKIKSPNPQYMGVSASLHFVNGEAETDDKWLIEWFQNKGYEVIEEEVTDEESTSEKPLVEMTHNELDAYAVENNVPEDKYPKSGNKEDKVAAIENFLKGE